MSGHRPSVLVIIRNSRLGYPRAVLALSVLTAVLPFLALIVTLHMRRVNTWCGVAAFEHSRLLESIAIGPQVWPMQTTHRPRDVCATPAGLSLVTSIQESSARFLTASALCENPVEPTLLRGVLQRLEYSVTSRAPLDGVLLYLASVGGVRAGVIVEVDGATRTGMLSASKLPVFLAGWNALIIHRSWSAFVEAQDGYGALKTCKEVGQFAGSSESFVRVVEVTEQKECIGDIARREGFGGEVDMVVLGSHGHEVKDWRNLGGLEPRLVVVFYEDYWGHEVAVTREYTVLNDASGSANSADAERERLYTGSSIAALNIVAREKGYKLIWCLTKAPVAIFARAGPGDNAWSFEQTMSTRQCLEHRKNEEQLYDLEARWNEAQLYSWATVHS